MKNKILKFSFLVLLMLGLGARISFAHEEIIPGDNDQERQINSAILESVDEAEVFGYLNNSADSVRQTACERLALIGTNYSLGQLNSLVQNTNELPLVKEAASLAFWRIKYREAVKYGFDSEGLLKSMLGISIQGFGSNYPKIGFLDSPFPYTPLNDGGNWQVS